MNEMAKMVNNWAYIQDQLRQDRSGEQKRYYDFKRVFDGKQIRVEQLIRALTYIGYFYPASTPEYDANAIDNYPCLRESTENLLNNNSDLTKYLYNQFVVSQNQMVIYKCYIVNNGQWFVKDILLTNELYTVLHTLLNKIDSVNHTDKTQEPFWNDEKFLQLINSIEQIKCRITPTALQLRDYTSIFIMINSTQQIYVMKDQQVKAVFDKFSALERTIFPAEQSYHEPVFAQMIINTGKDKLEANIDNAIKYLFYLTSGDINTLDNLAKDYISLATRPGFRQRNTIVKGDLDKLNKWIALITAVVPPTVQFIPRGYKILPLNYPNQRECAMEHIPLAGEIYPHIYCLCDQNVHYPDPGNQHIHLNFRYGGKYYELPTITANEYIWIYELLFAHGWHLINGAQGSRKAKTRNIEDEFTGFLNRCDENNEIRIPAALVYQLYTAYARKEKQTKEVSDSELYKLIRDKGIEYDTFKSRDADISYISSELKPIMEKTGIVFEDKWTEKNKGHKSFKCTISNELWKTLTAPSPEAENSVDEEKFSKYIKELFSRYEYLFKYETIESPIKNDMDHVEGNFRPIGSIYIK